MLNEIYNLAYFNGCSFTQGGGLETENDVDWNELDSDGNEKDLKDGRRDVCKLYKEKYGVPYWKSRLDVAYPSIFAGYAQIETINDSQSGGGIERIIRTTQNFIAENWENKDNTLIVLELADFSRLEFYSNTFNDFLLFNYTVHPEDNKVDDWFVCRDYSKRSYSDDNNQLRNVFKGIVEETLTPKIVFQKLTRDLINFLSFLKLNNFNFYITDDLNYELIGIKEKLFSEYVLPFGSPYNWAEKNRGRIVDEIDINDVHPGLLGHRAYAKELLSFLNSNHR